MTRIDIFSGFLGAGKTTLIKKLLAEGYSGEKLVLIENEFGEMGIDSGFLKDAGINVNELDSGCICCSLTGDFREALRMVKEQYQPDRILIEPSGVGKLSEVVAAVKAAGEDEFQLGGLCTVVDATRTRLYMKNFGEFFNNQVEAANCIVLSRTGGMRQDRLRQAEDMLRAKNPLAVIVSTPWDQITGAQILDAIGMKNTVSAELAALLAEHDDECDDPDCCCHHHDHEHHHHDEEHECCHHDHEHHHEHHHHHEGHECCHHDHEHGHHHHHGHDADEVFQSWGAETAKSFSAQDIDDILDALGDEKRYGMVVRAKGYVMDAEGQWIHFDYTPGEKDIRTGSANVAGRVCVIGANLNEDAVKELFGL